MRLYRSARKHAPRLLLTLAALVGLSVSVFAPVVSADSASYTGAQIHDWLVDTVTNSEATVTASPTVTLDAPNRRMIVESFSFKIRGIAVGLNQLRVTCDGTTTIAVTGELNLLGKLPRFSCDIELQYLESESKLRVADISNILIAQTFSPTLSASDTQTIVDVLNQILDSSELSVTSPGGDLTGIDVVDNGGAKLETTWTTGGPSYQNYEALEDKLDGMVTTLANKATAYLAAGEGEWTVDVTVVADTSLDIDAALTVFGVMASLDASITFSGLTATITDATFTVGSKSVTFSAEALIGCSNYIPYIQMQSLSLGDEHPGLRDFVVDIESALLDAIDQAVDDIVENTGLDLPCNTIESVAVVGENVVLTEGAYLIVGDVGMDGAVTMADVMYIMQYRAAFLSLDANQLRCADTTADGQVTMADAMHIMQFRADPDGSSGILYKPLYDAVFHAGMIDPLTL